MSILRVTLTLRAALSFSILSCPTDTPPFSGLNLLPGRDKFKVTRNLLLMGALTQIGLLKFVIGWSRSVGGFTQVDRSGG